MTQDITPQELAAELVVSQDDAIKFLGEATRHWTDELFLDKSDVEDVRAALQSFVRRASTTLASEAQPAQPALREDDIAEMLCRAAGPYASRKGSSGLTAWCRANGVAKSHASDFVNRKGPPRNDLLTALGIERTYRAALAAPVTEQPCDLCAGKCRGHPIGDEKAWEPEPGSRAYRATSVTELRQCCVEERERCAKVAEAQYRDHPTSTARAVNYAHAGRRIATAIRQQGETP